MGRMVNLTTLKLDHNQLEGSLIAEVRMMQMLRILDLSYNKMTGIPAEIGQLKNLESLDYSYNQITDLPNELANLKNLKLLNLTANPISTDKIQSLKAALPKTNIIF
jgi:Leucine-rich repeat (LRR) protein